LPNHIKLEDILTVR